MFKKKVKEISQTEAQDLLQKLLTSYTIKEDHSFRESIVQKCTDPANAKVFLKLICKFLVSDSENMPMIKEQICSPDNRLIEKAFSFIKKATRVVCREDYENYKAFNLNPSMYNQQLGGAYLPESSAGTEDYDNKKFNNLFPMYEFDRLEKMHDDPDYSIRLQEYRQRLEDKKNGIPVIDEEDRIKMEQERKTRGLPGKMLSAQNEEEKMEEDKPKSKDRLESRREFVMQKYGFASDGGPAEALTISENKERVDVQTRINYFMQFPPKDSVLLKRKYWTDEMNEKKKQLEHNNARLNSKNLTKPMRNAMGPRFAFPNFINEYEAFSNPIYSYIDEDGQIIQIDMDGNAVPRGYCFKPGTIMLRLTNNMRFMYVLFFLILKRCSLYWRQDVQKKAIFLETQLNAKKTPNALLQSLLFIAEKAEFERTVFPDYFNQILQVEGNINTQAAEIISLLVESPAILNNLMINQDFSYQVMQAIKNAEEASNNRALQYLVKTIMHLSQSSNFKLTLGTGNSIIEIYAYRLLIKSFLDYDKPNSGLLQYILQTFISLSRHQKFSYHLLNAIKQEKIDIIWRALHYFSILENNEDQDPKNQIQYSLFVIDILNQLIFSKAYSVPYYAEMIIIDIFERYYYEEVPMEVFVSLNNLVTKISISQIARMKLSQLIVKILNQPQAIPPSSQDGSSTPSKQKPKTPSKSTPSKSTPSKQKLKEMKAACILDENKLDSYLKKLYENLKFLYTYTGMTKQLFYEVKNNTPYFQNTEEAYERQQDFIKEIKEGKYDECYNDQDLETGGVQIEILKEAIMGNALFLFNEKSGLLKQNELVLAKDIPGMFMKFAYEDSLKLIILKSMQQDQMERRQLQIKLLQLTHTQNRLVDESVCPICKEMRALANKRYQDMIKHYFSKFLSISLLSTGDQSLQSLQQQEIEAQQFDKNMVKEIYHIELFQALLTFSMISGLRQIQDQAEEGNDAVQQELNAQFLMIQQLITSTICSLNENLHPMDYLCFSLFVNKIITSNIAGQRGHEPLLEFYISRNITQVSHSMFDILLSVLKNPKTSSFPLNLEQFTNQATGDECVIKSSKKGKTKLTQNLKKDPPSNPIYQIDNISIHAINHSMLTMIHILNQSRKKYVILLEKNLLTLMEQSISIISYYANAKLLEQTLKKCLKKVCKTIITFYFAIYEQYYNIFEQFFIQLDLTKLTEILQILKDYKNLKLANQILQILNCTLNVKQESLRSNKIYAQVFKTLDDAATNFIITDVMRNLTPQIANQLGFNNDKLTAEQLKTFDNPKNSEILQLKLSFCQIYFQLMIFFLSSDDSENFFSLFKIDNLRGLNQTLGNVLDKYMELILSSIEVDPVLINFFTNFTEYATIFLFFMSKLEAMSNLLQSTTTFNSLMKSIHKTQPISQNFLFAFSGLIAKGLKGLTNYEGFITKNPNCIDAIQNCIEKEDMPWEGIQFLTSGISSLASCCPRDKMGQLRLLAGPLRKVLSKKYFKMSESFISGDSPASTISDEEKEAFIDEVKYVLSLLNPADLYELQLANKKIDTSRGRVMQGAGLMSISTLNSLKNYQRTPSQTNLMMQTPQSQGNYQTQSTQQSYYTQPQDIVNQVDDEFRKILEKYTPQRELDMLAIARNSKNSNNQSKQQSTGTGSLRKTQSVAYFYFYNDKFNNPNNHFGPPQ